MEKEMMLSPELLSLIIMVQDYRSLVISENQFRETHKVEIGEDWITATQKYFFGIDKSILRKYGLSQNNNSFEIVSGFIVTDEMRKTDSKDLHKFRCWTVFDWDEYVKEMILALRQDGITLEAIEKELEYRDNASDSKWDDNLFQYTTEELADIEELWCEV